MKRRIRIGNPRNSILQPTKFEFCYPKTRVVTTENENDESDDGRDETYTDAFIKGNL